MSAVRCPVCNREPSNPWLVRGRNPDMLGPCVILSACVHHWHNQPPALALPGYAEFYNREPAKRARQALAIAEAQVGIGYA